MLSGRRGCWPAVKPFTKRPADPFDEEPGGALVCVQLSARVDLAGEVDKLDGVILIGWHAAKLIEPSKEVW